MKNYDHKRIETEWRKKWEEEALYKTDESRTRPKCYVLDMFPFPSGEGLHVGHPKGYIASDIYSRFKKMNGYSILHPMGWDAFGLPAEQYAIKNKIKPAVAVAKNIARYKEQLSNIGLNYDWEREINTSDPSYYKWTQWIFLKMFEKGLAYESYEPVNWCPSCQTGLANEDLEGNACERCGTAVEKKMMRQWVLRITDYADRMLEDLDTLNWPEHVKEAQKNWIGRSEGAEIKFAIRSTKSKANAKREFEVFTTRPDTLFGATCTVLAPEHTLIDELKDEIKNWSEVETYRAEVSKKTEIERTAEGKEKTGVMLEGVTAINPVNKEALPIFIADYVLAQYGTGAIMAVPAHDERDFVFAKKYNLPIKQVILPVRIDAKNPHREGYPLVEREMVHGIIRNQKTGEYLMLDWKSNPWTTFVLGGVEDGEDAFEAIKREIREETGLSHLKFLFKSITAYSEYGAYHKQQNRVAYPTAYFFECDEGAVQEEISDEEKAKHTFRWVDLSKGLPENFTCSEWDIWSEAMKYKGIAPMSEKGKLFHSGKFDGMTSEEAKAAITEFARGKSKVIYKLREWVFSRQRYWGEPFPIVHCEKDETVAVPEKDLPITLPDVEFYEPTGTGESPLANVVEWVNTTCPKCGGPAKRETNTMPNWAGSSWYWLRYIDPKNTEAFVDAEKEKYWSPVDVYVGGDHATRHLIYARFWHKFLLDIGAVHYPEPFKRLEFLGLVMADDGRKMSKRFGNVVNPDDIVETYGADTLRLYEMFMGPFEQSCAWKTESIIGPRRFLEKVWKLAERVKMNGLTNVQNVTIETLLHQTIKKVTRDIEEFKFNTAISSLMIFVNEIEREEKVSGELFENFLKLLAPFAPHITEELWRKNLSHMTSIHLESWPTYDEAKTKVSLVHIAVQINGKVRAVLETPRDITEEEAKRLALQDSNVKKWIENQEIKKIIFVKGKIVSIVV